MTKTLIYNVLFKGVEINRSSANCAVCFPNLGEAISYAMDGAAARGLVVKSESGFVEGDENTPGSYCDFRCEDAAGNTYYFVIYVQALTGYVPLAVHEELAAKVDEFGKQLITIRKGNTYPDILGDISRQYDRHFGVQRGNYEAIILQELADKRKAYRDSRGVVDEHFSKIVDEMLTTATTPEDLRGIKERLRPMPDSAEKVLLFRKIILTESKMNEDKSK